MRPAALLSAFIFLIAACSPLSEIRVLATTPAMVSLCYGNAVRWETVVSTAQTQCQKYGRNAELIPVSPSCQDWTIINGAHFRCVE